MQAALRPPDCRRALSARLVKNATGAVCSILIHCIKLPDRRWRGGLFVVPLTALPLPANNLPSTPFWGLTFYSQAFKSYFSSIRNAFCYTLSSNRLTNHVFHQCLPIGNLRHADRGKKSKMNRQLYESYQLRHLRI